MRKKTFVTFVSWGKRVNWCLCFCFRDPAFMNPLLTEQVTFKGQDSIPF